MSKVKPDSRLRWYTKRQHTKYPRDKVVAFFRRLAALCCAVLYIVSSIQSSTASIRVLRGAKNAPMKFEAYETTNLIKHMGNGPVNESPLVVQILKNDTTPRNYSLYFEEDTVSMSGCQAPLFNKAQYSNFFMRLGMGSLIRDTYYNLTELLAFQLILPIVDCSFTPLRSGSTTVMRMYYLMRKRLDPSIIGLFAVRFNMQNYRIVDHNEAGPVGLVTYAGILNMQEPLVTYKFAGALGYPFEVAKFSPYINLGLNREGWWLLSSISANQMTNAPHQIVTASRTGFYVQSDNEQSNIKNLHWGYDDDPVSAITKWNWKGEPVLRDSWAWVHLIHAYFAIDGIFNMMVLFLVILRNLQMGKIWVGDAFVSISSSLVLRGFVILVTWIINDFWALMELCLHDAHYLAGTQEVFFHPAIMHADLLTIHLAVSSLLGSAFHERIDPVIAIIAFEIGWNARLRLATTWFPSILAFIKAYAVHDNNLAVVSVSETVSAYSPLRLWTTHPLPPKSVRFVFSCLFPILSTTLLVLGWVVARKIYRIFRPDKTRVIREGNTTTASSLDSGAHIRIYKQDLTIFEVSTGVGLQSRYGVICDYENYHIIKGLKFASLDGIYSSGFVIANARVLIATADLPGVIAMKLLRMRFRNIYVYQLEGNTVQRTAMLLYPTSLTWSDLLRLNVTVLS